ncbi:sulfatase-like hydrolase/transferase [Maribellus comscasis]|uniref:Sulfatase-like hydrolase/transferase n=1 Tax=Maribellus comscasis TaxID=2681766 RepID=A0A6I6JN96_9BACT|nr:sulfatase-like hydrolase/transferase [Maribellus comscasis]QGY42538.1 sulfatase-like hydrolase/transferase [Maribellus comscasis]
MKFKILTVALLILLNIINGCHVDVKSGIDKKKLSEKPNIIFLLADDLRSTALGCMGNSHVITPNIDELAGQSVMFLNAYHVAPICMPSRTSIMTGKYLGTHGSGFDRPTNYVITKEEFETSYPVLLRNSGYYTGFIGKFGFAVSEGPEKLVDKGYENKQEYMPKKHFDVWNGFPGQGSYRLGKGGTFNGYENIWHSDHLNEFMGHQAIEFIEKANKENKPFCLSVSFKAPHAPFDPQEQFRKLYDKEKIPRMNNDSPEYYYELPKVVQLKSRNADWYFGRMNRPDWHIEIDSTYEMFIKNYYSLITGLDNVVGQIRQKVDDLGIAGKTVIIFTSDNGFFCGSRQLMGKAILYDESAKAPLIVYDPRYMKEKKGITEQGLVSIIDIAPTILSLADVAKPESMPGESIMPIVWNEKEEINDAVYGENNFDNNQPVISEVKNPDNYQSIRSKYVRTKNFKYIRYPECHPEIEELFEINKDTLEANNLVHLPEYEDIVREMREKLDSFEKEYVRYHNTP